MSNENSLPPAVAANKRLVTVGLMWHSLGSGNLGVGALTESNIAIVRGVAEQLGLRVRFIVLGTSDATIPALTAELAAAGHELQVRRIRVFRGEFRDAVRGCDLVLDIGEGDSWADIYGMQRFRFHWLSKNIVRSLGKPLILSPQTIGPFDGALARWLACQVMRRCTRIFARDNLSSACLRELGITSNVDEAIDVAFRLPFARPERAEDAGKVRVGINVSGLLFNGGYTGNNQFGLSIDYAAAMRELLRQLAARPEVEVHLVSHVIEPHMPVEDDVTAARQLATEFPGVIVAPVFTRPSEAKTYIAGMDFFTGARMHACIAAFSSGVPVVPIAYSRKFNGLFGTLGYEVLADGKKMKDAELVALIIASLDRRAEIRPQVAAGVAQALQRLSRYEDALRQQLSQVR
ncbi:MAG: polysaccharide pyruvyl transferase family protein [Roseateles sp.]